MNATPASTDGLIVIGKIYSVHGVRGEVKVYSFTDPVANLLEYKTWTLRRDGNVKQVELVSGRGSDKFLVAKLKGLMTVMKHVFSRAMRSVFRAACSLIWPTVIITGTSWKVLRLLIKQGNCSVKSIICLRRVPTM